MNEMQSDSALRHCANNVLKLTLFAAAMGVSREAAADQCYYQYTMCSDSFCFIGQSGVPNGSVPTAWYLCDDGHGTFYWGYQVLSSQCCMST